VLDVDPAADLLHRRQDLAQHILVDPDPGGAGVADDGEGRLDVPPRQLAGTALARRGVEALEPGRQSKPDIEALAVDAADFPRPARAVRRSIGAGETGHAAE